MIDPDPVGASPFPVYGLRADDLGPRRVAGVGHTGETINLVALSHGDAEDPGASWVQVTVTGPLAGNSGSNQWAIDPLPMVAAELLNAAGAHFADSAALHEAVDVILAREPDSIQLFVDDAPTAFRAWYEKSAWAAVSTHVTNHMVYVIARHIDPKRVELISRVDLGRYASE